jgi:AraC-like DNA-binding protein/mannose-6-phosphate isomerase-like protein (cupin superfamily)
MFYEKIHSSDNDYFWYTKRINSDFAFPLHLHQNYEFVYVEYGEMNVRICDKEFCVSKGEGVLILPEQPHALSSPAHSMSWIVIFSHDHIPELRRAVHTDGARYPIIIPEDKDLYFRIEKAENDSFKRRSILYSLAALYLENEYAEYLDIQSNSLVRRIADYLDLHYTEPITLEKMSSDLGYNYRYVSGVVNKFFRLSFLGVVNRYRVNYACDLLVNTEKGITEISMICGFESTRSFNRNFRSITGVSPRDYRSGRREANETPL